MSQRTTKRSEGTTCRDFLTRTSEKTWRIGPNLAIKTNTKPVTTEQYSTALAQRVSDCSTIENHLDRSQFRNS